MVSIDDNTPERKSKWVGKKYPQATRKPGFVGCKDKNVKLELAGQPGRGDVWTFVAIDADTKLVPCWLIGKRDARYATMLLTDLAPRLNRRIQLTTDGHRMYLVAVENAFGGDVDYSQLVKIYGNRPKEEASRYSPPKCLGCKRQPVVGNPDPEHISTSYVERQNLTVRIKMRRCTRLTNAFSKKLENLEHACAMHFFHYNFVRVHQTLLAPRSWLLASIGTFGHWTRWLHCWTGQKKKIFQTDPVPLILFP